MPCRHIFSNDGAGGDDAVIPNRYAFQDNTPHPDITTFPDSDGLSSALRAPEPTYLRRIFMLLAIVYNGIRSHNGVLPNFNMIGTDNLAATQPSVVMQHYAGTRLYGGKRYRKAYQGVVFVLGMQHHLISQTNL